MERGDNGCIGLGEVCFDGRISGIGERGGNVILEETDDVGDLLQRDLGVYVRRVLEVLPSGYEDGGDLLFARDDGLEAFVGRGELSLHQAEDAVCDSAGVVVGILLPLTDGL